NLTWWPLAAHIAATPPAFSSQSSGWAPKQMMRSLSSGGAAGRAAGRGSAAAAAHSSPSAAAHADAPASQRVPRFMALSCRDGPGKATDGTVYQAGGGGQALRLSPPGVVSWAAGGQRRPPDRRGGPVHVGRAARPVHRRE